MTTVQDKDHLGVIRKIFTRRGTKSETLEPLERGVFAAVRIATNTLPATSDMLSLLTLTPPDDYDLACWKKLNTLRLPLATEVPRAIKESDKAARQLQNHAIRLTGLLYRWIFPETFNAALNTGLNKSDILSQTSLQPFDLVTSTLTRPLLSGVIGMVAVNGMQALFRTALMLHELSHYQKQRITLITIFATVNIQHLFILV